LTTVAVGGFVGVRTAVGRFVAVAVFSAGETVVSPGSESDDMTRNIGTSATMTAAPNASKRRRLPQTDVARRMRARPILLIGPAFAGATVG
jgi:hypothetical protein